VRPRSAVFKLMFGALLMALALAACSSSKIRADDSSNESSTRSTGAGAGAGTTANTGAGGGSVTTAPRSSTTAAAATPDTSPGTLPASGPTGSNGPTIVSFAVTGAPACPVAATAGRAAKPGRPITLAWTVTGATSVGLSIDDPTHTHSSGTYEPVTSVTLSFPCDPTNLPNNSHLYTLVAGTTTKTITASATTN
jgi:hypothetical protein